MNKKHIAAMTAALLVMTTNVMAAPSSNPGKDHPAHARYEVQTILKDGTTSNYALNDASGKGVEIAAKEITSYVSSCEGNLANAKELITGFAFEIAPSTAQTTNGAHISWDYKKLNAIKSYKIDSCEIQNPEVSVENGDMDVEIAVNESFKIQGKNVDIVVKRTN